MAVDRKKMAIFTFLVFVLALSPFLEGFSNDLVRIIIYFLAGFLGISLVRKKQIKAGLLEAVFLVFLFFCLTSTAFSKSLSRSLPQLFLYLSYFLTFLFFRNLGQKARNVFLRLVSFALVFISVLLVFYNILFLVLGREPINTMNLIYPSFGHSHLVDFLVFAFPLSLAVFIKERNFLAKVFFLFLILFFFFGFVMSFSRGGLFLLILGIVLFFYILKLERKIKIFFVTMAILAIFWAAVGVGGFYLRGRGLNNESNILATKILRPLTIKERFGYWQQGFETFQASPFVGTGLDSFRYYSLKFQKTPQSFSWFVHNHYFQMFAETGFFGGLAFLILIYLILKRGWVKAKTKDSIFQKGFAMAIILSCAQSLFDYNWQFSSVFLIFWAMAGLLIEPEGKKHGPGLSFLRLLVSMTAVTVLIFGLKMSISEGLFLTARRMVARDDSDTAQRFFEWGLKAYSFSADKYLEVSKVYPKKELDKAIEKTKKAEKLNFLNWGTHKMLAELYKEGRNLNGAQKEYRLVVDQNPLGSFQTYLDLAKVYEDLGEMERRDEPFSFLAQKVEGWGELLGQGRRFAKFFYRVGEIYLKDGELVKTGFWWKKAADVSPQWSYFYTDLASLYLNLGELNKAEEVLKNCLKFYYPKQHCQEYLERFSKKIDFEPPGYWRAKILAIPD